jgi:hypothetical protein
LDAVLSFLELDIITVGVTGSEGLFTAVVELTLPYEAQTLESADIQYALRTPDFTEIESPIEIKFEYMINLESLCQKHCEITSYLNLSKREQLNIGEFSLLIPPPLLVLESKDTITDPPSLENIALDNTGTGGLAFADITFKETWPLFKE